MRALLDISMLLALFDEGHIHHARALSWWQSNGSAGWASCPLTQNGYLRIVSQRSYPNPVPLADALGVLRRQIGEGGHAFWPDDVSLLDPSIIDHTRLLGPSQLTDVYLLSLAVRQGGRLVALDTKIPLAAAKGADASHLVVIL